MGAYRELLAQAKKANHTAIQKLYERYYTLLRSYSFVNLAIRFSSFSTPIIALSAEKSEDVAQRKMPCRHSSNVTPFPAKQAFTTKSPQRKR